MQHPSGTVRDVGEMTVVGGARTDFNLRSERLIIPRAHRVEEVLHVRRGILTVVGHRLARFILLLVPCSGASGRLGPISERHIAQRGEPIAALRQPFALLDHPALASLRE